MDEAPAEHGTARAAGIAQITKSILIKEHRIYRFMSRKMANFTA